MREKKVPKRRAEKERKRETPRRISRKRTGRPLTISGEKNVKKGPKKSTPAKETGEGARGPCGRLEEERAGPDDLGGGEKKKPCAGDHPKRPKKKMGRRKRRWEDQGRRCRYIGK